MTPEDLGPAEHLEAGAVGEPGRRTFFVHVQAGGVSHWYHAEKQQVGEFADRAIALLLEASIIPDPNAVSEILARLGDAEPDTFAFRVGTITLRASEARELIHLEIESADEQLAVSFQVAPEQLQAMATHAESVVAAGRELCERCRLPMDPVGHKCPSTNGYHVD
jgi:uncharacterized repeat protein (TIGR03847 family)